MDNRLSKSIMRDIGGIENIDTLTHCTTRLRFRLRDMSKADTAHLRDVRGVLGVLVSGGVYMVVVGKEVKSVYRDLREMMGARDSSAAINEKKSGRSGTAYFFAYTVMVAGTVYTLLELASVWSLININGDVMRTLEALSGFGVYILPLLFLGISGKGEPEEKDYEKITVYAPINGRVAPLSEATDASIASGTYGDGVVICPESNLISSPANGHITEISRHNDSVALETEDGVELLIQIGADIVGYDQMFKALAAIGEKVCVGDPLIEIEKNALEINGVDVTTAVIVTNSENYGRVKAVTDIAREQKPILELWK